MKPRHISDSFLKELKTGFFKPVVDIIRVDPSLDLELRGNSVIVYYRGGRILKIAEPQSVINSNAEAEQLLEGISADYMKDASLSSYLTEPTIGNINAYFANAKHLVDVFVATEHTLGEKEIQQRVIAENNYSVNARETDFFIADMELADNDGLNGRADIVAFYWGHMSHKKKKQELTMYLIEVKQGHKAIKTNKPNTQKEGPGLLKHYHDFCEFRKDPAAVMSVKADMLEVLRQKTELGLVQGLQKLFVKDADGNLTTNGIVIRKDIDFVFLLANYLHHSKQLRKELLLLPNYAQFFCASFVGYGLYKKYIVTKKTIANYPSIFVTE